MHVQVLSTPGCAECAAAKRALERIRPDYPVLQVEEIDVSEQPEVAARYGLLSAPGIVVDGELVAAGHVSEAELRRKLDERAGAKR